ncbi:MAG: DPP IV N-terminal domain-containing protein [Deltaproteobacteria bacterium]|nr:DPP IV N-terminal domain-containing protein [Deltaproteobacteria bacterium]
MNRVALPSQARRALHLFRTVVALCLACAPALFACRPPGVQHAASVRASSPSPVTPRDVGFLAQYAATFRFRQGHPTSFAVTPDGRAVLFLRAPARSLVQSLYEHDLSIGRERVLLTAEQLLRGADEALSAEERSRRERMRLVTRGIVGFQLSSDGKRLLVPLSNRLFLVERATGRVEELAGPRGVRLDPRFSPDGERVAYVRGGDVYVYDVARRLELRLTTREKPSVTYGLAEFVAQEEMGRMRGFWWSPDGKALAVQETRTDGMEAVHLGDLGAPTQEPHRAAYPRAGRKNAEVRLGILPTHGGTLRWVSWDRARFPYLAAARWEKGAPLTLVVQSRRQTELRVLTVDATTGATELLLEERDPAWLNLDPSVPRWIDGGRAFLWSTERDGAWTLELRDGKGARLRTLVPAELGYRQLLGLDRRRRVAFVQASPTPTEQHLYAVPLDGETREVRRLTREPGEHGATVSEESGTLVVTGEGPELPRRITVLSPEGGERGRLRSVAERPPFAPRLELTSVTVGPHRFHTALVRPRAFDPALRYPVVAYVYGGPHHQTVTASPSRYLLYQWVADQGFVVVCLDGRGTPARGRAFERALKGAFGTLPLEDQAAGLRALGARYPELDLARVGVFGWSFGGYLAALAVLKRPEVYRAGVAVAAVADWLDYDTHYTERYLGLPAEAPAVYREASLLTHAPRLSRPLLLVHGTSDDNVTFSHSLRLSDALFRAARPHAFLPLLNFTHLVPDALFTVRLYSAVVDFFRAQLGEPQPR